MAAVVEGNIVHDIASKVGSEIQVEGIAPVRFEKESKWVSI